MLCAHYASTIYALNANKTDTLTVKHANKLVTKCSTTFSHAMNIWLYLAPTVSTSAERTVLRIELHAEDVMLTFALGAKKSIEECGEMSMAAAQILPSNVWITLA